MSLDMDSIHKWIAVAAAAVATAKTTTKTATVENVVKKSTN